MVHWRLIQVYFWIPSLSTSDFISSVVTESEKISASIVNLCVSMTSSDWLNQSSGVSGVIQIKPVGVWNCPKLYLRPEHIQINYFPINSYLEYIY